MKRIEFIAPVESMRGNLGSKQALVYAPNNNRAFDSIEGQLNPALNYEPRLIGAKGKRNYFCVKTKSSNHLTTLSKTTMANLGGVGAVYGAVVRDKSQMVYINAQACYHDAQADGYEGTFRKYMYGFIKPALDNKEVIIIESTNHYVEITNPWTDTGEYNIPIQINVVAKFWMQLADDACIAYVSGLDGQIIFHEGEAFGDILGSSYNVMHIEMIEYEEEYIAAINGMGLSKYKDRYEPLYDYDIIEDKCTYYLHSL